MPNLKHVFTRAGVPALLAVLVACAEHPAPAPTAATTTTAATPSSAGPFFRLEAIDAKVYRALTREQDLHLASCAQERACDQAHFSRALLALFENQRTAAKHFQDVITGAPKSRLAGVSADWLRLLQSPPAEKDSQDHLARATQSLILELLNREQAAKEELNAREKKLEELASQLETLKLIDQEMNEKAHRIRPRARPTQPVSEPADAIK
jgi:hypothetical protein